MAKQSKDNNDNKITDPPADSDLFTTDIFEELSEEDIFASTENLNDLPDDSDIYSLPEIFDSPASQKNKSGFLTLPRILFLGITAVAIFISINIIFPLKHLENSTT